VEIVGLEPRRSELALLGRDKQAGEQLLPVEFLTPTVFFHHHVWDFVDTLVGGEALLALETLAAPADKLALFAFARIHHFVIDETAEGTLHGGWLSNDCSRGFRPPAETPQSALCSQHSVMADCWVLAEC